MKFWKNLIKTHFIAAILLGAAGLLAIGSMWKDSAIRDEMPHIVA